VTRVILLGGGLICSIIVIFFLVLIRRVFVRPKIDIVVSFMWLRILPSTIYLFVVIL